MARPPSLAHERSLLLDGAELVAGMDEVGRGALSGPVTVGVVVVDASVRRSLAGVRDSKLLNPAARDALVPRVHRWAVDVAVGHASPAEIDDVGIIGALRRAGTRALGQLRRVPDVVLLDGSHDWLTRPPQQGLWSGDDDVGEVDVPPVVTRVKADLACSSVAAASVIAKCARDALMAELHEDLPVYGWCDNKGYATVDHREALAVHGPSRYHRRSWNLLPAERRCGGVGEPRERPAG